MPAHAALISGLKAQIAVLEGETRSLNPVQPFGDPRVDACLAGGGLALGAWHELAGEGVEAETCAAPAAFAAVLAGRMAGKGEVVWVLRRDDLFAPGLFSLGFPTGRLIQVCAPSEAEALAVMEDALATSGVAAVVGEAAEVSLKAGRRLQLACEKRGSTGLLIRRRAFGGRQGGESGSAAASRWRIEAAPSVPEPDMPGLGSPRFRVELERCRGGRPGAWIMELNETGHAAHPFHVVADLGDLDLATQEPWRAAG